MIPSIVTDRLILRPFTQADADDYYAEVQSDPVVMQFLVGRAPRTREQVPGRIDFITGHYRDHGFGIWAVTDKATGAFMGQCGLNTIPASDMPDGLPGVEIAYALGQRWWGHGYATEGVRAALAWGFDVQGLETIWGVAYPENTASRRVMTKAGMTLLGVDDRIYHTTMAVFRMQRGDPRL